MQIRFAQSLALAVLFLLVLISFDRGPGLAAQTPAGAAIPRTPEGKPEMSGIWQVMNTAEWDIQDHQAREGIPAGVGVLEGDEIPYQPWALAKKKENFEKRATLDPVNKCWMPGVPRITYMPWPFQIMQMPQQTVILYEWGSGIRYLYTNGAPHPKGHIDWFNGDSRAKWEGDSLVVDLIHFNDITWLDRAGDFHSDQLHVVETYTMTDKDHIKYDVTLEDPKVYTRPWKMHMILYRHTEPNFRILEYICNGFRYEDYYPYPGL